MGVGRSSPRLLAPEASGACSEHCSLRTSRLHSSSTTTRGFRAALRDVLGIDFDAIVERMDDADVTDAYERDKVEARSASGSAAEAQRKTSTSDGPVRFTAPTIVFERNGARLIAGGWQPILGYDVLVANLEPELERHPVSDGPPSSSTFRMG